jgi:hypothetical protein
MTPKVSTTVALLSGASVLAISLAAPAAADLRSAERYAERLSTRGDYLSGDKHNHTTCTDGTTSVRTLVDRSTLVYDLDWFAMTGHGGSGNRDCRFDDVATSALRSGVDEGTLLDGANSVRRWTANDVELKGDDNGDRMWRWQQLIEYVAPDVSHAGKLSDKATWTGVESNVPGHEHVSMGILGNQFRTRGDAYATGQFEYLWDRGDNDFSGGEEYDFENPANNGVEKLPNVSGDHEKSRLSVAWMREHHQYDSYYVPAHIERQGAYVAGQNRGFNVEHVRDYHNAGLFDPNDVTSPSVAFGAEFAPGHQLQTNRGSYSLSRPTAGFGTYGGAGAYGVAEITVPGKNFDGSDITDQDLADLRAYFDDEFGGNPFTPSFTTSQPKERYVFGRPGVRTMWDALLGEGRRYGIFYSSDWHNRGSFGPYEPYSTNDAWPGEYQKIWAYARGGDSGYSYRTARSVVEGMRSLNSWSVMGDLIDELYFVMCQGSKCATMGETLVVDPNGDDVTWYVKLHDPEGENNSPYEFNNPSLLQMNIEIPINKPEFDNIDIIRGDVTGPIAPTDPEYATNVANPTTEIFATKFRSDFDDLGGGYFEVSGTIPAASFTNDMYFRMRGTNMPKGTPNETDADGNPLLDYYANNIPCPFPYADPDPATDVLEFDPMACPFYLPVNAELEDADGNPLPPSQVIDFDVEAWTDLWFHANPIFVEVEGGTIQEAAAR